MRRWCGTKFRWTGNGAIPAPVRFAGYIMHQDFWMSSAVFLNSSTAPSRTAEPYLLQRMPRNRHARPDPRLARRTVTRSNAKQPQTDREVKCARLRCNAPSLRCRVRCHMPGLCSGPPARPDHRRLDLNRIHPVRREATPRKSCRPAQSGKRWHLRQWCLHDGQLARCEARQVERHSLQLWSSRSEAHVRRRPPSRA